MTPEAVAVAGCESVSDAGLPLMLVPLTIAGLEMVHVLPLIAVIVLPPGNGLGLAMLVTCCATANDPAVTLTLVIVFEPAVMLPVAAESVSEEIVVPD